MYIPYLVFLRYSFFFLDSSIHARLDSPFGQINEKNTSVANYKVSQKESKTTILQHIIISHIVCHSYQ